MEMRMICDKCGYVFEDPTGGCPRCKELAEKNIANVVDTISDGLACPDCGYIMDDFTTECPRCHYKPPTPPAAKQPPS